MEMRKKRTRTKKYEMKEKISFQCFTILYFVLDKDESDMD